MRIARVSITNFRGIQNAELLLPNHCGLIGDNNVGKSTVLEAIDLVLGPERLYRRPPIDEHDFYAGRYLDDQEQPINVSIEVVVSELAEEQIRHFAEHLEWWSNATNSLITGAPPEQTNAPSVLPALRVSFLGSYDADEDDFVGSTHFNSPENEDGTFSVFKSTDKRLCGFLFLRTLRTGRRALSLERGSLLDVILRLQEKRLRMWEQVLGELRTLPVAADPDIGLTEILTAVQKAVRNYVPMEWADEPHLRVSDLTREGLRGSLAVFLSTGAKLPDGSLHAAPFEYQGTGTVNTLVLSLLSLIADLKQNVIFAMEEPEIAIPPHTQRQVVSNVRSLSSQSIFTSHSPYVLAEMEPEQLLVLKRSNGRLLGFSGALPPAVKPKKYKEDMRKRFCEALLSRRVLVVEGRTEYDAMPAAARRLSEINPAVYSPFEAIGIATIDAETDSQVEPLGKYFKDLGKDVYVVFDKQKDKAATEKIRAALPNCYESPEFGFERLLIQHTAESALRRFADSFNAAENWPTHLGSAPVPAMGIEDLRNTLHDYLVWSKGSSGAADLVSICDIEEMPEYIVNTIAAITALANTHQSETSTKSS